KRSVPGRPGSRKVEGRSSPGNSNGRLDREEGKTSIRSTGEPKGEPGASATGGMPGIPPVANAPGSPIHGAKCGTPPTRIQGLSGSGGGAGPTPSRRLREGRAVGPRPDL